MKTVGFIGVGLMCGSMALAMRQIDYADKYIGLSRTKKSLEKAKKLGIIDSGTLDLEELIESSDLIVLGTPVSIMKKQLPEILDLIDSTKTVIDLGSTKESLCNIVQNHPNRNRFLACHPMAGTEYSGPEAAFATLYENKVTVICDKELTDNNLTNEICELFTKMQMRLIFMTSKEHDKHIAYVSHLSHVTSFALSKTVLEEEKNNSAIFDMAGSGFSSTVRLAKSSPEMWSPIFFDNLDNISKAIENYLKEINELKSIIEKENREELISYLKQANSIKNILK